MNTYIDPDLKPGPAPDPTDTELTSETQHTPLPWKWDGEELWHFGEGYQVTQPLQDPHRFTGIVSARRLEGSPILDANKELIIRAVNSHAELLECLELFVDNAEYESEDYYVLQGHKSYRPLNAIARAREVIAKAKGETP